MVDALVQRTTYNYDAAGRQVSVQDARGYLTTSVYDAAGMLVATVDPQNNRTTFVYDASGREIALVDALNQRTTQEYYETGWLKATVDPLGNRTTYNYDAAGHQVSMQDAPRIPQGKPGPAQRRIACAPVRVNLQRKPAQTDPFDYRSGSCQSTKSAATNFFPSANSLRSLRLSICLRAGLCGKKHPAAAGTAALQLLCVLRALCGERRASQPLRPVRAMPRMK